MRILFDQGTPAPLAALLIGHTVERVRAMGWETLANGDLLTAAEAAGFEMLVTTDKHLRYQQNLTGRALAIVVLGTPQWPVVRAHVDLVAAAVNAATPSSYTEVAMPRP
jgi:hypothetical protein